MSSQLYHYIAIILQTVSCVRLAQVIQHKKKFTQSVNLHFMKVLETHDILDTFFL